MNDATLEKATSKPAPYVGYSRLLVEVHVAVRKCVPRGRTVLVVSRGDEQFVRLEGRRGWHFPRHEDGRWGGYHPADSEEAIAHLEELRSKGAQYLVFPETALWWLDYYEALGEHLDGRYRIADRSDICLIYDITTSRDPQTGEPGASQAEEEQRPSQASEVIDNLLPPESTIAVVTAEGHGLAGLDPERTVQFRAVTDDASAVEHLEELFSSGVEYLVIARSAFDWLDERPLFAQRLREHHRLVMRQQHLCEIYELIE